MALKAYKHLTDGEVKLVEDASAEEASLLADVVQGSSYLQLTSSGHSQEIAAAQGTALWEDVTDELGSGSAFAHLIGNFTTDSNFIAEPVFDLGGIRPFFLNPVLTAVVADGETFGPTGISADLYRVEISDDTVTWVTVQAASWLRDIPYDGSQSLPHTGWGAFGVTPRYVRARFRIIDSTSFDVYAGPNHPSATFALTLDSGVAP